MTEEQPEKKKSRKRKTGASAWWKNVLPDTEKNAEASPVETVTSEQPENGLSTQDRSGDAEALNQSVVTEGAGEGGEATAQNEKKPRSRKRSTRNRRAKKDIESTGSEQVVDEQVKEISPKESDGMVSPENEMAGGNAAGPTSSSDSRLKYGWPCHRRQARSRAWFR